MLEAYLNIFIIFLLIFIGYLLSWKNWFDSIVADVFSKLVLNISLPVGMFLTITQNFTKQEFLALFSGMLLPFFSIVCTFILSILFSKVTHVPDGRKGAFQTMFTASNTIFMGLPINLAIFGERAVPYVLLYYICNTTFFWTVGIFLIARDNQEIQKNAIHFHPLQAMKKIVSPALLGFVIGIVWILLQVPTPNFLLNFSEYLGGLTTPLSMFFIGITIYQIGIRNLKLSKDTIGVLIGRYVISPLLVLGLSYFISVPPLMLQVFIIQSAMPVQNSVPILARSYNGDSEFAASTLTYSVLAYLFVIPVLLYFIL